MHKKLSIVNRDVLSKALFMSKLVASVPFLLPKAIKEIDEQTVDDFVARLFEFWCSCRDSLARTKRRTEKVGMTFHGSLYSSLE